MLFGIDRISFYIPHYFIDLDEIDKAQDKESDFFKKQTGQKKMAIPAPNEDVVTMGANAAERVLTDINKLDISMVLFATESGIDQSKAAGMYVHHLLGLSPYCRVFELKQACYGATAAIQLAIPYLQAHTHTKILLIAADVARYDSGSLAEASQGAGAVAMLLSAHPRVLALDSPSGFYAEEAMDFWRPNYRREAFVEGRLSCDLYLKALKETWNQYHTRSAYRYEDHAAFCYHVPVPRLAEKAHQRLAKMNGQRLSSQAASEAMHEALFYAREVGNCYSASLYMSLISLLEHSSHNLTNKRIGLYSYGSGCTAEFFSGVIQAGYQTVLEKDYHSVLLKQRHSLDYREYQDFFHHALPQDGSCLDVPQYPSGNYCLARVDAHKRFYERV